MFKAAVQGKLSLRFRAPHSLRATAQKALALRERTRLGADVADAQAAALVAAQREGRLDGTDDADGAMVAQGAVGVVTGIDRLSRRVDVHVLTDPTDTTLERMSFADDGDHRHRDLLPPSSKSAASPASASAQSGGGHNGNGNGNSSRDGRYRGKVQEELSKACRLGGERPDARQTLFQVVRRCAAVCSR